MSTTTIFSNDKAVPVLIPGYLQAVNYQARKAFFPLITTTRDFSGEFEPNSRIYRAWRLWAKLKGPARLPFGDEGSIKLAAEILEANLKEAGITTLSLRGQEGDPSGRFTRRIVWRTMWLPKSPPFGGLGEQVSRFGSHISRHAVWYDGSKEHARTSIFIECPFCNADPIEGFVWSLSGGGKTCEDCGSLIHYGSATAGELVLDCRLRNQLPNRLEKYAK